MKPTLNEKFLAYLALLSGISLSIVAEYYSILGLTAIFAAAVLPVIVMGIVLGIGKVSATLWLKQNWQLAPWSIRLYLGTAIVVLMMVTSMGTFGFLSKAHSDQNLVSGDVLAKIAVYDEKINTSKENIDANRKALKQMDEAVDQVMGRSTTETGADKAVGIRRAQQRERARLQSEITAEQKTISQLSEERAPVAAEVRKVEAEVGPIKYIAAFVYGNTDPSVLERAVTWVIILIIVVFDPLAVILLLSSQISFQNFRERTKGGVLVDSSGTIVGLKSAEGDIDTEPPTVTNIDDLEPVEFKWNEQEPHGVVAEEVADVVPEIVAEEDNSALDEEHIKQIRKVAKTYIKKEPKTTITKPAGYVQNEEQSESDVWSKTITQTEYDEVGAQRRRETIIAQWAARVKNNEVGMHHVPVDILEEVKARV